MSWIRNERYRSAFVQLLSPNPNERILDVGAGKGAVADFVQRSGSCEVHALDPNQSRIEFVKRTHPNLNTCLSGSGSIPYTDGFFDKVYSTMAVHHFPDQSKSFTEMSRVLKSGGILVIMDIAPTTLVGRIDRFWENGVLRAHLKFLALRELTDLIHGDQALVVTEARAEGSGYFVRAAKSSVLGQQSVTDFQS